MAGASPEEAERVAGHVLFRLGNELHALPVNVVREMVRALPAARVPGSQHYMRGVINLRGTILPLLDLRLMLGMTGAMADVEALCELLEQRQRDHEAWLTELERCVRTGDPFTKATDPHKCAFGVWYDNFKTEHLVLRSELSKLDAPHQAIHATAKQALELSERGKQHEALGLIEAKRTGELATLIRVLTDLRALIRDQQRELVIVIEEGKRRVGVCVDQIEGVEPLPLQVKNLSFLGDLAMGSEMVLRKGSDKPVRILEARHILGELRDTQTLAL